MHSDDGFHKSCHLEIKYRPPSDSAGLAISCVNEKVQIIYQKYVIALKSTLKCNSCNNKQKTKISKNKENSKKGSNKRSSSKCIRTANTFMVLVLHVS